MRAVDLSQFRTRLPSWRHFVENLVVADGLEAIGPIAAAALLDQFHCEGASVGRRDGEFLEYVGTAGMANEVLGRRIKLDASFTGRVVEAQRGRLYQPKLAVLESKVRARVDEFRSGMVAPIVVHGEVIGTVGVVASKANRFGARALAILEEFAGLVSRHLEGG